MASYKATPCSTRPWVAAGNNKNLGRSLSSRRCLQLGEGADVVHQVPGIVRLDARALTLHRAFALINDVVKCAVGLSLESCGVAEIGHLLFHALGHVAAAAPILSMTQGALVAIDLLGPGQGVGRRFHWVHLVYGFQRNAERGRGSRGSR